MFAVVPKGAIYLSLHTTKIFGNFVTFNTTDLIVKVQFFTNSASRTLMQYIIFEVSVHYISVMYWYTCLQPCTQKILESPGRGAVNLRQIPHLRDKRKFWHKYARFKMSTVLKICFSFMHVSCQFYLKHKICFKRLSIVRMNYIFKLRKL